VCRISAEFMQMTCRSYTRRILFYFWRRILTSDNPSYATVVPAVHSFSHTYPTLCLPIAGFESINSGNNVSSSFDVVTLVTGIVGIAGVK